MKFHNPLTDFLERLRSSPAENPLRELRLLVAHVLGVSHEQVLFDPPDELSEAQIQRLKHLVERRCRHEPLAKILGYKEFWGLRFKVTADTLDPRPDSEVLIETALHHLSPSQKAGRFLDLGTGSGCLLLSLLSDLPKARGIGVDISEKALAVAQKNAEDLGLLNRSHFIQSNWFEAVEGQFNLIIANPPYIDRSAPLSPQTLYDPERALFAADHGLAEYKTILKTARPYLANQGLLIFEIGATQTDSVIAIAQESTFQHLATIKDLGQRNRCLVFKK
jgi:release factor glutamine methyltransferase